jgi:3-mercaptopyruvate sulfurtransferase SseA
MNPIKTSLLTPAWLLENMEREDVKILDASWFLPSMGIIP